MANICTLQSALTATVEVGDQRGRLLGFPTANLHPEDLEGQMVGVYAALAQTADGSVWPAAVNVGTRPTFYDGARVSVEVHLLGFEGDIYGQPLSVQFISRIRDEMKFEAIDDLIAQLRHDIGAASRAVASLAAQRSATL